MNKIDKLMIEVYKAVAGDSIIAIQYEKDRRAFKLSYSLWSKNDIPEYSESYHRTRKQIQTRIGQLQAAHPENHSTVIEIATIKPKKRKRGAPCQNADDD